MKSRTLTCITAMTLFACLAFPMGLAAQKEPLEKIHRYKLVVIGTLGGPQSYGDAGHNAANVNKHGVAVGVADTDMPDPLYPNFNPGLTQLIGAYPFIYHAFTTRGGTILDLGALPGGTNSVSSFITENGLVSGQSLNGDIDPLTGWPEMNAVLWKDGKIINLGTLGGHESGAGQVNSRGQVTGVSTNSVPDPFSFLYPGVSNGTQTRAFVWDEKNGMQDLGTLGGPDAFAPLINEGGQIAGFSFTNFAPNSTTGLPTLDPFLWENGRMIDLGTLGGTFGVVGGLFALNRRGQVVGQSNLAGDVISHPFLWTAPGPMLDLGSLGGTFEGANTMNDAGTVIGGGTLAGDQEEINDHGEIFGIGTLSNGDARAFLLIPVGDGDPEGISATPENLAALAAKTGQISVSATQSRKVPRDMAAVWRSRFTGRYHLPSLGTPKD